LLSCVVLGLKPSVDVKQASLVNANIQTPPSVLTSSNLCAKKKT
jgi:hypothetical protein